MNVEPSAFLADGATRFHECPMLLLLLLPLMLKKRWIDGKRSVYGFALWSYFRLWNDGQAGIWSMIRSCSETIRAVIVFVEAVVSCVVMNRSQPILAALYLSHSACIFVSQRSVLVWRALKRQSTAPIRCPHRSEQPLQPRQRGLLHLVSVGAYMSAVRIKYRPML